MEQDKVDPVNSRLPGFYELGISERAKITAKVCGLTENEKRSFHSFGSLNHELTDTFIENSIGTFCLPLGVATNFSINGKDVLIPMAVEESSVVAAASHGAKLVRLGGGFQTSSTPPIMTGQVQVFVSPNSNFDAILRENKEYFINYLNRGQERLIQRGGGAKDLEWRYLPEIQSLVIHLYVHTVDAMGANMVNTMCERLGVILPTFLKSCEVGLKILTNLTDRRIAKSQCLIPVEAFEHRNFTGLEVAQRIVKAWEFAWFDIYRAATHNKGVMNGIDPVLIATGNDWRAVEAGAHAYASQKGSYRPLTLWSLTSDNKRLQGTLEIPMAVGTVGGVTKLHPTAQASLKMLGSPSANDLAEIIVSVGLAQNLSALRALATEGIQSGHMDLHQKNADLRNYQLRLASLWN